MLPSSRIGTATLPTKLITTCTTILTWLTRTTITSLVCYRQRHPSPQTALCHRHLLLKSQVEVPVRVPVEVPVRVPVRAPVRVPVGAPVCLLPAMTGSILKGASARIALMARCRSMTLHHATPAPRDKFVAMPLVPHKVAAFLPMVSVVCGDWQFAESGICKNCNNGQVSLDNTAPCETCPDGQVRGNAVGTGQSGCVPANGICIEGAYFHFKMTSYQIRNDPNQRDIIWFFCER